MSQATRSVSQKNWQAEATDVNHSRRIPVTMLFRGRYRAFIRWHAERYKHRRPSVFDGAETMHAQSFPSFVGTYVHTITCAHCAE